MRFVWIAIVAGGLAVGGCGAGDHVDPYAAGQAAERRGELSRAVDSYGAGVKAGQSKEQSFYRLGVLYSEQKQYARAASAWEKYVALKPRSAEGWGNLGQAYEQGGDLKRAEGAYKRGIDADPEDHSCQVNLGLMLARHGHGDEGLEALQGVMKPAEAHYSLGAAYEQAREKDAARAEYREALALDPSMKAARDKVGP